MCVCVCVCAQIIEEVEAHAGSSESSEVDPERLVISDGNRARSDDAASTDEYRYDGEDDESFFTDGAAVDDSQSEEGRRSGGIFAGARGGGARVHGENTRSDAFGETLGDALV